MNYLSFGDMAFNYQLRSHGSQLKKTLSQLSEEVTTGIKQDIGKAVGGNFSAISAIETSIARATSYSQVSKQATIYATTMQSSLELVQGYASSIGGTLKASSSDPATATLDVALLNATQGFESALSALNTQSGGRYLFSGIETQEQSFASADLILSALEEEISGLTTSEEIILAIETWFDAPPGYGGFSDVAFNGSSQPVDGIRIAEGRSATLPITGASQEIRDTLEGFSIAALAQRGTIAGDLNLRTQLASAAGNRLVAADSALAGLRGTLGTVEEVISDAEAVNTAETSALKLAQNSLIIADPYETATALKAVETQIETLYTLTSRLSKLSLVNYL